MRSQLFVLPLLCFLAAPALGQSASPPAATQTHAAAPEVVATPAREAIRIDGRLDETAWGDAIPVTSLTQVVPSEGRPETQRTEVRVLFDADALYIGARLYDSEPVSTRLVRRDGAMEGSDWLTVILDSYHDHRSAFGFEVNPSGVRRDQTRTVDGEDDSWDPVWEAATSIDAEGWTAELRIPLSQLRFNTPAASAPGDAAAAQVWGIQIERTRARNQEFSVFAFTPSTEPGGIPRFGHLSGLRGLRSAKRLEVLPYSVVRAESVDRGANPFRDDRDFSGSAGVDLKYRVTSDLTLDATLNPDFGQVELDPADVNLGPIPTRFQEKRPFFVEGAEIFSFGIGGGNEVFYSRRVGRAPQLQPNTSAADVPQASRIIGAAKLSGRTRTGWAVGAMNAVTQAESARYLSVDSVALRMPVEPLTSYSVARLRRDSRAGQSVIGGMFSAVNRSLETPELRGALHSSAYTGGLDFRQQWNQRTWTLSGFVSGSYVAGAPAALIRTQSLPWRYFQRPDAPGLRVDSSATSLAGLSSQLQLEHRRGRHWRGTALLGTITPGYEINDLGFQVRANRIDNQLGVRYLENRPGRHLRSWQLDLTGRGEWNYDGEHIANWLNLGTQLQTLGYWVAAANLLTTLPATDDRLTRGGPLARRPASARASLFVTSDRRRSASASWEADYQRDEEGGWLASAGIGAELRPAPSWNLSLTPRLFRSRSRAQFVASFGDPLATHTFGARHVFAELDQTTVSLETRLNVTFNPDLSLQVYAQPFVSAARFFDYKEFATPRGFDFLVYGRDLGEIRPLDGETGVFEIDPDAGGPAPAFVVGRRFGQSDFNLRELRGNAVLRWEWRPGSTLYLAWQQTRSDLDRVGDFQLNRDPAALFSARADNVLVLKVNYWLNP